MRKKLLIASTVLVGVLVIFLILVALQPDDYRVSRTATMAAPPATVFPHVNDLQKWQAWSPWAKLDPNATNTFKGPPAGQGAVFHWSGNSEVGEGQMTITESRPNDLVRFRLEFFKPMAGVADSEFTFVPQGTNTAVTWTMTGKNNFIGKAFCLFMNMDKMIGESFEQGLSSIRGLVEKPSKP